MSTAQVVTPIQKVKSQPRPHQNTTHDLRMRIVAIEAGRTVSIPEYRTVLAIEDLMTHLITRMGVFSSDRQAILFAVSGLVAHDPIPFRLIVEQIEEHRRGFLGFELNVHQVQHLLGNHRLVCGTGRYQSSKEVTIYTDAKEIEGEEPWVVDVEMPTTKPVAEGRKFR